jgi:hypothetical protein
MVVVVANTQLEQRGRAGWFDAADESGAGEHRQDVVHGLGRDGPELVTHPLGDSGDTGMRMLFKRGEHRDTLLGHPQGRPAQPLDGVDH